MRGRAVPVTDAIAIAPGEITLSYVRASGPGGQNVNKVATKAVARFNVARSESLPDTERARALRRLAGRLTREGELVLTCSLHREQRRNRTVVLERLGEVLAHAVRPPQRRKRTRPSRAAIARSRENKRHQSERKRARRPVLD